MTNDSSHGRASSSTDSKHALLGRLAPTPSGFLHIGNAFGFCLTWLLVRSRPDGRLLLRIDDLDAARKRQDYVEDIFYSLDWLGLDYDLGPGGPDDFEAHWSQQHRLDLYDTALNLLDDRQQLFACHCSRTSIRQSPDGLHPRACKQQRERISTAADGTAWRIDTCDARSSWKDWDSTSRIVDVDACMRDFVVRRKDGVPAYQVASVVDDGHFGVNLIVRGADLLESTAAQIWLSSLLPDDPLSVAAFHHHVLLTDETGQKFSKSEGANSLRSMRLAGEGADTLYRRFSHLLGFDGPVSSSAEALEAFKARSEGR